MNPTPKKRLEFIDAFRGFIMTHMALDHVSSYFNHSRWGNEFAAWPMKVPADIWQFLTRFTGVFVAPAFSFMAGFMMAWVAARGVEKGKKSGELTRRFLVRGILLVLIDYPLVTLVEGFSFAFVTLSCLGVCMILVALLRFLGPWILAFLALGIFLSHPFLMETSWNTPFAMVFFRAGVRFDLPGMPNGFLAIYPVLPWLGIMLAGYVAGTHFHRSRETPRKPWFLLAGVFMILFFVIRFANGYGNFHPHSGFGNLDFWFLTKYPPDLAWITYSLAQIFFFLGFFSWLESTRGFALARPILPFGGCPLFFYLLHFMIIYLAAVFLPKNEWGLGAVYPLWILLLFLLYLPCRWYGKMKWERPNLVTRYL